MISGNIKFKLMKIGISQVHRSNKYHLCIWTGNSMIKIFPMKLNYFIYTKESIEAIGEDFDQKWFIGIITTKIT